MRLEHIPWTRILKERDKSGQRDLNSQQSVWKTETLPLSYARNMFYIFSIEQLDRFLQGTYQKPFSVVSTQQGDQEITS